MKPDKLEWIPFEKKRPNIGQEIFIVWPSGNYHPEYRIWNEDMDKADWSHMRWIPIPDYKNLKLNGL